MDQTGADNVPLVIGRYELHQEIASGGMATVHLGRFAGPAGFSRPVAIKRLHPHLAKDPEFVAMFLDEARLAARIQHPNVVPTLDVVASKGEVFLVMEFVQGETLTTLWKKAVATGENIHPQIVGTIMSNVLHGLHAAHEARNERGELLRIVHRDVSPQNVMLSLDGVARVLDFGVAKAIGRLQTTRQGSVKGKYAYMAPEQLEGCTTLDQRVDVFAAGVVCWELLSGRRLFDGDHEAIVLARIMTERPGPVSGHNKNLPKEIDQVLQRALERDRDARYATAREFALALERVLGVAPPSVVGEWVAASAGPAIEGRAALLLEIEKSSPTPIDDAVVRSVMDGTHIPSDKAVAFSAPAKSAGPLLGTKPRLTLRMMLVAGILVVASTAIALVAWSKSVRLSDAPMAASSFFRAPEFLSVGSALADASDENAPTEASSAPASTVRTQPAGPPRTRRSIPKRSGDCNPPYSLDADGHKIWKRQCLK